MGACRRPDLHVVDQHIRRVIKTDPRGKTTTYAYDNADRLVSVTDRIGRVREFGYDDADRMTSETWKLGGSTVQTQTFGYDAVGNQTSATDPDGSYALTYDNLNRVVQVAGPWGVTQSFGYDAADNRVSASDSKGGSTTSSFDNLNRLVRRTQTASGMGTVRADWGYNAAGDMASVTRFSDAAGTVLAGSTTNSYDALGRLVGIDHKNAVGSSVGAYSYTFDTGDRLTSETFNGTTKSYSYDKLGQLTDDNGLPYSFDKSGNRTNSGYVTATGNRTTTDGTWTYTYDDEGQMVAKSKSGEAWAYTYDFRGQMTSANKSASPGGTVTDSVSYKVDAWGNRIERAQSGSTSSTERYVVDGWDTAKPAALGTEEFDTVIDLDGSNAVKSRRVFGSGFDSAVARQDVSGSVTWYGADVQGTVRQVFDNSGNVTGSRTFSGFGAVTAGSGTGLDRIGYTGTSTDTLTGLVGDDARQYDPTLGKWTSDDPIGFAGGDYNVGRYVGNQTTSRTDPSGLADPVPGGLVQVTKSVPLPGGGGAQADPLKKALAEAEPKLREVISEFQEMSRDERQEFLTRERQRVWSLRYALKDDSGAGDRGCRDMSPEADKWFENAKFGNGEVVALMLQNYGTEAHNVLWRAEKLGLKLEPYPSMWLREGNRVIYLDAVEGRRVEYATSQRLKWIARDMFNTLKANVKDEWLEGFAKNVGLRGRYEGALKNVDPEMEAQLNELDQLWAAEVKFAYKASEGYYADVAKDQALNLAMSGAPRLVNGLQSLRWYKEVKKAKADGFPKPGIRSVPDPTQIGKNYERLNSPNWGNVGRAADQTGFSMQAQRYSCQAAALETSLTKMVGRDEPIVEKIRKHYPKGFGLDSATVPTMDTQVKVFKEFGIDAVTEQNRNLSRVLKAFDPKKPMILEVNRGNGTHVIVIEQIMKTKEGTLVQLVDPAEGRLIVTYQTLFHHFTGWYTMIK